MRDTRYEIGSALILAVVLTSLLAIVGVMFLMVARVDRMATSGISENKELNFAVETVIAKISQELVLDVPGVTGQEYYDYPDPCNTWLASLEPYDADPDPLVDDYRWQHISDIYDRFGPQGLGLPAGIIPDYQDLVNEGFIADADGDGVSDSVWVQVPDMNSSKGKPIFAAIRIVDNGAMLNVNTAYKFDPNDSLERIDGSSQTQINLAALSQRGANGTLAQAADRLHVERCGTELPDLSLYEQNVVWQYNAPAGAYAPFDISDELELRNRFLLNQQDTYARIERIDWTRAFLTSTTLDVPRYRPRHNINDPNDWFWKTNNSSWDVNEYDYRHIGTTYNMDRIINPNGEKMVNVNTDGEALLYAAIRAGLYKAGVTDPNNLAAQMAVNIVDYRDDNDDVSTILVDGATYYGFERPCIYISELAHNFVMPDPNDPNTVYRSYAIELYKPYFEDNDPCAWQFVIDGSPIIIDSWTGGNQFYVIRNEDPCAPLVDDAHQDSNALVFNSNSNIFLQRPVGGDYIIVDLVTVPEANETSGWLTENVGARSIQRDITLHKCIRRLWSEPLVDSTLGNLNNYPPDPDPDPNMIQAHPYLDPSIYENKGFKNVGEIGIVFCKSAYPEGFDVIGPSDTEATARIDLANPDFQQIFKYLTVFDPTVDGIDNNGDGYGAGADVDPNELKIAGRININTAPWYVIAQLPWMRPEIAQAIVGDRDIAGGFGSIGQLNSVVDVLDPNSSIDYYWRGDGDQLGFPDLTSEDGARDDFEERDLIFSRISNLVTVRSDVFTAYILVRIGADGPQKRVIAILDRSNVYSGSDKVRIVALHPVPDPR